MNYETIEDEVYEFIDEYFDDELTLIESNLDFIEDNRLVMPKVNYTHLYPFLSLLLKKFQLMDHDFPSPTIIKMGYDIKHIEKTYGNFLNKTQNYEDVFNNIVVSSSEIIQDYSSAIKELEKMDQKSSDDFVQIKHMKQNLLDLKNIYFSIFETIFFENFKNIDVDFKTIINTKLFYLDKLIWRRASKSQYIMQNLQSKQMNTKLNAESYLNVIMSVMRPYTDEYKYLEKCLKVYQR